MSKHKVRGIRRNLLLVTLLPIILLGIAIIVWGMILISEFYTKSIQKELISTTGVMLDSLDFAMEGDYSYEDGILRKGEFDLTHSAMFQRIKEISDIDTTIFWGDTRIMTTLKVKSGASAIGTKAEEKVVESVCRNGENYYSNRLNINGVSYTGYYMPLMNSDGTVVGMVFAGKSRKSVYEHVATILLWFVALAVISAMIAFYLAKVYSKRMLLAIDAINGFIKSISNGNLTVALDEEIIKRKDEIGEIGRNAAKMQGDLQKLIETDPLTSLYNRRSCNRKLSLLEVEKKNYTIAMCDIDWFKKINDEFGHAAGDYVLVTIAEMLAESVKDCGFASRWGGEEFLLIYEMDSKEAQEKVKELRDRIREHAFTYADKQIAVTMTFGIENSDLGRTHEARINEADTNLYIGKRSGRDRIVCSSD